MDKEDLLKMCNLLEYGISVNEVNKHWYDKAINMGYVEVRKIKRSTKFFLTETGVAAIQPILYLHIYRKYYFVCDQNLTEEALTAYHNLYPELDAWDLLIQYHKEKVDQYDGNRKQKIPRTYIYFIAKLYEYSSRPKEALRYYILTCILDLSGVMEVPTMESMRGLENEYKPGGRFYKSQEDIKKKAILYPGLVTDIKKLGFGLEDIKAAFTEVYGRLFLPVQAKSKEEMLLEILNGITEDNDVS